MATAVKTNEHPGTRAQARFVRVTPSKARAVLDLIRGKPVDRALEILEFSERAVSADVMRTLESAVANAEHNDEVPADELYVSACYADEGPSLKRWRPRARGRATRIHKRTSHITIIVSRLSPEELEARREREESRGGRASRAASDARRRRVEKSRQEKAERKAAEAEEHDHDHDEAEASTEVGEESTETGAAGADDSEGDDVAAGPVEAEADDADDTEAEADDADDADDTEADADDADDADDTEAEASEEKD